MFYTTVAGWMLHYFYMTATGKLAGLNADQVAGKFVEHFSTGMRKRLHLAILLASEADIWLLDEPGANLDDAGRSMVRREARRAADAGKLVLLATNDREEEAVADACISLSGH